MKGIMRVLYLYAGIRKNVLAAWQRAQEPDNRLLGLNHLRRFGIAAEFLENRWTELFRKISFNATQFPAIVPSLQYDAVFSGSGLLALFIVKRVLRRKKPRWILFNTYFANLLRRNRFGIKANIIRAALASADAIISTSTHQNAVLAEHGLDPRKLFFIGEGIDRDFYSRGGQTARRIPYEYVFSAGRDIGRDYGTLLKAVTDSDIPVVIGALPRNFPGITEFPQNVCVEYFPPDVYRAVIRESRFMVVSAVPDDNVRGSDSTGLYVLLEAMACGKAVIVSRRRAFDDYFTNGKNGIVVEPEDPRALKEAIRYLWDNPRVAQEMGTRNRELVFARFTTEQFAKELAEIIARLCAPRAQTAS